MRVRGARILANAATAEKPLGPPMTQSARVESVAALEALRTALAKFAVAAQGALGSAASEIRRVLDELDAQLVHWEAQVNRWQEEVGRAKAALAQRRWGHDK